MKFNIIIPNYNCSRFLEKCILSCVNQSHSDYKIIFIDNESSDDSLEIAKKIQKQYPEKIIIDSAPNIYPYCWDECITKAFDYMDGDFFTIIAADDWIEKDYLRNFENWLLEQNREILIAQSSLIWIQNNEQINYVNHEYNSLNDLKKQLIQSCCVNTPTVFFSTKLVEKKLYTPQPHLYSGAADYALYCHLVDNDIYIENIGKWIGYNYHIHEKQATWSMNKNPISYSNIIQKKWKDKWKI
jgi:glycosyltransferase involved in cell wall biosynthesis